MISFFSTIDHNLFWLINSSHCPFFDYFFSIVTNLGNGWVATPILLSIVFLKIPRNKQISFIVIATFFMVGSALTNTAIKRSNNRPRPLSYFSQDAAAHGRTVHVVGERLCWNSFPSGHSNTAFSAATLLALRFGGPFWWSFAAAGLVGYSRIYLGAHFPSDVAGGGALGVIILTIGMLACKWYDRRESRNHVKQ